MHPIPKLKCFSSHLAVASGQFIETLCKVENEDVEQRRQAMLQLHLSDQQF